MWFSEQMTTINLHKFEKSFYCRLLYTSRQKFNCQLHFEIYGAQSANGTICFQVIMLSPANVIPRIFHAARNKGQTVSAKGTSSEEMLFLKSEAPQGEILSQPKKSKRLFQLILPKIKTCSVSVRKR